MAKKQINNGTAIWIDSVGAIKPRVFNVIKEDKEKGKVLISFNKDEVYWIKKGNIRAKRIIIYQKRDGSLISQNPDNIGRIDLDAIGIKTLRFNLQNSSLQESRSAIYRWTSPKDTINKLSPIFKLMFICIAVGVMGWAALKFGGMALDAIMRSRLMDCAQLLPKAPSPIGTIINGTIPVGA
ncbi:MAG: hypothetical protein PHS54_01200 [Clostridia bacterium]|nr:hypothetical protein [Clostridia bacterium]